MNFITLIRCFCIIAGVKAERIPLGGNIRCMEVLDIEKEMNSIMKLPIDERLNAVCS